MKNAILALLFIALSTACQQEEASTPVFFPGEQELGWAQGIREGQQWESSGYWEPYPHDSTLITILFETYNEDTVPQEIYGLTEIPLEPGNYTIRESFSDIGNGFVGGTYVRLAPNGIAVSKRLQVNDGKNGFVTISEYDSSTKTVKGSFEMFFISEDNSTSVEVTDGTFEVSVSQ